MSQQKILKAITEVAEQVDWSVTTSKNADGSLGVNFNTNTKFGQDLNCWGTLFGEDYQSLVDEIQRWYEGFDPDQEAILWVGTDGHGKNGAPYNLRDILDDMEDAESRLKDLAVALQQIDF